MADEIEKSPTGTPFLPPKFVPLAAAIVAVAVAVAAYVPEGPVHMAAMAVVGLGVVLGITSPGARK